MWSVCTVAIVLYGSFLSRKILGKMWECEPIILASFLKCKTCEKHCVLNPQRKPSSVIDTSCAHWNTCILCVYIYFTHLKRKREQEITWATRSDGNLCLEYRCSKQKSRIIWENIRALKNQIRPFSSITTAKQYSSISDGVKVILAMYVRVWIKK